jgi:5-methylcytosine-specific restriction enzyme A
MTSTADLVLAVNALRTYQSGGGPARHQAITLLWAIGRARRGAGDNRMVRWSEARSELTSLLSKLGRAESWPSAEYPFVALRGSTLWELSAANAPAAHGSGMRPWRRD